MLVAAHSYIGWQCLHIPALQPEWAADEQTLSRGASHSTWTDGCELWEVLIRYIVYSLRIVLQQVGDQLVHCWKCRQCPLVEWEVVLGQMPPHYHQFALAPSIIFCLNFLKPILFLSCSHDLLGFGGFVVNRTASEGKFYGTSGSKNSSPEEITQIIPEFRFLSYKRPYKSRRCYVRSQDLYCVWRNLLCLRLEIVFMGLRWNLNYFSTEKTAVLHVSGWDL